MNGRKVGGIGVLALVLVIGGVMAFAQMGQHKIDFRNERGEVIGSAVAFAQPSSSQKSRHGTDASEIGRYQNVVGARGGDTIFDTKTVEAGRVLIKGKIDSSHDLVVRIDRGEKPTEWRSSGRAGIFEVVVEASDKIRLDGGKTGHGFVVTTKQGASTAVSYVHCAGDLAGTFAIRREADLVTKEGVVTFADITLKDGKKLPVSLRLALKRTAATARADDAANEDIDRIQGRWRVVSSQVGDEKALEAEFKKRRLTFTGDKLTYEYGNVQQEKREGTVKLDPKTGTFDWTVPLEGGTSLAIYELKGDTLKIGFGNDGLVRPKQWEIGKENVVWLLVLKRESQKENAK